MVLTPATTVALAKRTGPISRVHAQPIGWAPLVRNIITGVVQNAIVRLQHRSCAAAPMSTILILFLLVAAKGTPNHRCYACCLAV